MKVDSRELITLLEDQLEANNNIFSTYMDVKDQLTYKRTIEAYLNSWNGKAGMDLYNDLYKARFTWDNYAGAVLMLKLVKNMELRTPVMDTYKDLLIEVLIAAPNKRMDAETLQDRIEKIPKTNILHGQRKLNMNVEIAKKIKNVQASIHNERGQRRLLI